MKAVLAAPALLAGLIVSAGCNSKTQQQPAMGYGYVGPSTLNLRKDLGPRAPTVEQAKHGDRLEVLEMRRRFVKVRTESGVEGWTDSSLLLTQGQMDDLDHLAEVASKLPSQGKATVFDVLNVHTDASRPAPSFTQIPEGGKVEVLAHRVTLRTEAKAPPKAAPKPDQPARKRRKDPDYPPPPAPPAPKPPSDWVERSIPHLSDLPGYRPPQVTPAPRPRGDDWYLVRLSDGKAGYVLARNLYMLIPDEVAQHAEGHHITAYLPLGSVKDRDGKEHPHWLWTTSSESLKPYEFDSFRVFSWSTKRSRYETAFIERNVEGYYPIAPVNLKDRTELGFTVVVREKDGGLYKRTYGFSGYRVRMISKERYQPPPELPKVSEARTFDRAPGPGRNDPGWMRRLADWWKRTIVR